MSISQGKRYDRASKHATRSWDCPICGRRCVGNGGKSSHKRKHVREAGIVVGDDYRSTFAQLTEKAGDANGQEPATKGV